MGLSSFFTSRLNQISPVLYGHLSEKRGTRLIFGYVGPCDTTFNFSGCREFLEHMIPPKWGIPPGHLFIYFYKYTDQYDQYLTCFFYNSKKIIQAKIKY